MSLSDTDLSIYGPPVRRLNEQRRKHIITGAHGQDHRYRVRLAGRRRQGAHPRRLSRGGVNDGYEQIAVVGLARSIVHRVVMPFVVITTATLLVPLNVISMCVAYDTLPPPEPLISITILPEVGYAFAADTAFGSARFSIVIVSVYDNGCVTPPDATVPDPFTTDVPFITCVPVSSPLSV